MKKAISVILSLALVFSLLSVSASAVNEEDEILFAVASDLHYNIPEEELTWFSEDPIFGYANRRAAMENESGFIIDEFLNQCAEDEDIQFVLIPGDLADNGKSIAEEHYAVAEKFKRFEETSGKEIYVINGNHDNGNDCATEMADFKEIYADFGYDKALTTVETDCSYTANLGQKYRLIALDSCDYSKSTEDGMTEEKVQWVIDQAELAKAEGRYPILMMHHNLLDHLPMQRLLSHDFIIRNHLTTAGRWADAGIKLVFTGHEHCSDATSYTSAAGNTITDFATTSLTMYPLQYRFFEVSEETISYRAMTVDSIDTDALDAAVDGYSQEQLDAMNNGLNAFAKEYLKNGVEYRLELGFTDEKLGVSEGDIYYDIVRTVIDTLNDNLNIPLYGEGSVAELGEQYGITLPESNYKDGWDLATELVAAHYAGSEDYPLKGTEVTLLLRTVSIILKAELALVTDEDLVNAASAVLAGTGMLPRFEAIIDFVEENNYAVTPLEYLILAIASPLLDSFANDDDVDDNNGELEGYGEGGGIVDSLTNAGDKFLDIIGFIFQLLEFLGMAYPGAFVN